MAKRKREMPNKRVKLRCNRWKLGIKKRDDGDGDISLENPKLSPRYIINEERRKFFPM